jgi:hypothetical protein
MSSQTTVLITGNTYPVREAIKALGGVWDSNAKGWRVPITKADEARELVNKQTETPAYRNNAPRRTCAECGRGGALVQDMEDGLLKHYSCCDMPPSRY